MDPQLKRGILNICILQLLMKEDRYGYDIIKIVQKFFTDTEESTLYAILRRLNKEELTDMYYSEQSLGPKRKYYTITDKGKECLNDYISSWHEIEKIFSDLEILQDLIKKIRTDTLDVSAVATFSKNGSDTATRT